MRCRGWTLGPLTRRAVSMAWRWSLIAPPKTAPVAGTQQRRCFVLRDRILPGVEYLVPATTVEHMAAQEYGHRRRREVHVCVYLRREGASICAVKCRPLARRGRIPKSAATGTETLKKSLCSARQASRVWRPGSFGLRTIPLKVPLITGRYLGLWARWLRMKWSFAWTAWAWGRGFRGEMMGYIGD